MIPAISDQDMNAYLADESRHHFGEFNITSALYELYKFVEQYGDQLLTVLEEDEAAKRSRLPAKFAQMVRTMDGDETTAASNTVAYSNRASHNQPPPPYDTLSSSRR